MKLSRSQQENIMLEERNKIFVEQLQNSTPSLPEMVSPIMQVSVCVCVCVTPFLIVFCAENHNSLDLLSGGGGPGGEKFLASSPCTKLNPLSLTKPPFYRCWNTFLSQMNTSLSSTSGLQTLLALSAARNYSSPTHHHLSSSLPSHHGYTLPTSPPTTHQRSSTPLIPPTSRFTTLGSSQTN